MQLDVELRSLAKGCLDTADLGNLATNVEVDEAQTVVQSFLLQEVECFEQLGTGKSELAGVATALFPFA